MKLFKYLWIWLAVVFLCQLAATAAEKKEFIAKIDKDGVQRIEMVGGSYFFNPNYIVVSVNVPVEIKIRKESGVIPHDIVLKAPEAGIDFQLELKDTPQTVRFTPTKVGTYPFDCSKKVLFFGSHKDKGMEGTLEVRAR
ncbi:MAG: hypothetical protein CSYNP_02643 [Syntrophus sp. SKADARSKE-3]|nr:hypothetical protein [Syntrophus sp. SKADARSKE-3]